MNRMKMAGHACIFWCVILAGCSSADGNASQNETAVYETYERTGTAEDIIEGDALERYAAVKCDVVKVKILSQDSADKTVEMDGKDEQITFTHYKMDVEDVIFSETLTKGDEVVLSIADWMTEEYPSLKEGMTYIIPIYAAEQASVNAGSYLVADYSLFYAVENQDNTEIIRSAYVEDQIYDGLSVEEFKKKASDVMNVQADVVE